MERKAFGRDRGLSARMFTTMFLLGALYVVFFVVLTSLFEFGFIFALVLIGALAFFQYFTSDKIALKASGAKKVDARAGARAARDGRPALRDVRPAEAAVAIIPSDVPNAFATGRNPKHSAVAVTRGLWIASSRARSRASSRTSSRTSGTATSRS